MVEIVDIAVLPSLTPALRSVSRRVCTYMADDLMQEAFADLIDVITLKGPVPTGYAIKVAARAMRDYYIANRTPVYIPSRTMRDKAVKEYTKLLAELWMGADNV